MFAVKSIVVVLIIGQIIHLSIIHWACKVKPVLAVASIKQPTCLKQPNKIFPNLNVY